MRKAIQIILLVLIIIGLGLIFTQKYWVPGLVDFILKFEDRGQTVNIPKNNSLNFTFTISGRDYTLINGKAEKEVALDSTGSLQAGSVSKEIVRVFGEPVVGDLNGDGVNDEVMYLTQETGGSGTFFYVVEAINQGGVYKGTNAMFLGDRIAPQNINIINGRAVANFAERKAGEPFTTQPSVGKSVWIYYDAKLGEIGEWVKDFEGESNI
jgi:hypothetical protein